MIERHSSITFNLNSPPANVYEYNLDLKRGPIEKGKNMENVNKVTDADMAAAALLPLDQITDGTYTDEEFEAILAQSDVKQDAEDLEPETFESERTLDS